MTKAMKKLLTSVVFLVIAISLAVTTTFAWFTMNATPQVGGLDLNVTSTDGLYITATKDATDDKGAAGTWTSKLESQDILSAILEKASLTDPQKAALTAANGQTVVADKVTALQAILKEVVVMDAVTSTDGKTFTQKDGTTVATKNSYLTFDLYFSSASKYAVKLNDDGSGKVFGSTVEAKGEKTTSTVAAWKEISANEYGHNTAVALGDPIITRAANAARVAFNDNATTAAVTVWDPNSAVGYSDNVKNIANEYYDIIHKITTEVGTPAVAVKDAAILSNTLLTLTGTDGDYDGKMTITIWLEGWDGDCFNSILKDAFTTKLQFKGTVVA